MKMNQRGQIGKLITSVPVMIGLFVIMALFLVLSFHFAKLRQPGVVGVSGEFAGVGDDSILWDVIEVDGKKMFVWEAFVLSDLEMPKFNLKFEEKVASEKFDGCFVIAKDEQKTPIREDNSVYYDRAIGFSKNNGVVDSIRTDKVRNYYFNYLNRIPVFVGGKEKPVFYYQGRCLDE